CFRPVQEVCQLLEERTIQDHIMTDAFQLVQLFWFIGGGQQGQGALKRNYGICCAMGAEDGLPVSAKDLDIVEAIQDKPTVRKEVQTLYCYIRHRSKRTDQDERSMSVLVSQMGGNSGAQ